MDKTTPKTAFKRTDPLTEYKPIVEAFDVGDYAVVFDDQTGEASERPDLQEMVDRMRVIANEYDYDLSAWGDARNLIKGLGHVAWVKKDV